MKAIAELYESLDSSNRKNRKVELLREFFDRESAVESAWTIFFFLGGKLPRICKTTELREWVAEFAELPLWLVEESYDAVGDLAETLMLLTRSGERREVEGDNRSSDTFIRQQYLPLLDFPEPEKREGLFSLWRELSDSERFLFNKCMTGGLRVGVSKSTIVAALAELLEIAPAVMAHRLSGDWLRGEEFPTEKSFTRLLDEEESGANPGQPYPFYLAYPLNQSLDQIGRESEWFAEWKWDGIRAQLIRRSGQTLIWSRGEESVAEQFPEVASAAEFLPDGTVLDGEILAWDKTSNSVMEFAELQRRIGRKRLGKKLLSEVPVVLLAFDLLEFGGRDLRELPFSQRRAQLEQCVAGLELLDPRIRLAPQVKFSSWPELTELRAESRQRLVEGLMLKRKDGPYLTGRKSGGWWKWKIDPLHFDGVMIYAQKGHGRRANVFSDYTFAVWNGEDLVPVAKAYSGLTDAEMQKVDRFVKSHTTERFGPVRAVEPRMVFEIAFEGIRRSSRHKSGIALRFPRISRIREDKSPKEANTLKDLEALLSEKEPGSKNTVKESTMEDETR